MQLGDGRLVRRDAFLFLQHRVGLAHHRRLILYNGSIFCLGDLRFSAQHPCQAFFLRCIPVQQFQRLLQCPDLPVKLLPLGQRIAAGKLRVLQLDIDLHQAPPLDPF